jgi:outer membrane lipoprotein LolB
MDRRRWEGRLLLQTEGVRTGQWAVDFVLEGTPESGELLLSTPWGNAIAAVRWQPGGATLRQNQTETPYPDLQSLTLELTGTALPIAALLSWLEGQAVPVEGWQVDLGQHSQGRLQAERRTAEGTTRLRLVLERP